MPPFDLTALVDADTFQGWLAKGLGRAVLYLQAHDDAPVRAALLHAIANDMRYDRQCEDGRAPYLFDAIQATRNPEIYRRHVLDTLPATEDGNAESQLMELAMRFAQQDDTEARAALYDAFHRNAAKGFSNGANEIVTLDGIAGFLHALDHLPGITRDDDEWEPEWWVSLLEERDGKDETWSALERLSMERDDVQRVTGKASASQESKRQGSGKSEAVESYASIRQALLESDNRMLKWGTRFWGVRASDEDILQAARDLLKETDEARLPAMLRIFTKRRFPLDHSPLLALARHPNFEVANTAFHALINIASPDVRQLALDLADDPQWQNQTANLLVNNYQEGDYAVIERLVEQPAADKDQRHWLEMSVRRFIKAHPSVQAERPLLMMYESGPCSICRGGVVDLLLEMEKLPEWMRAECLFDANPYTREAVETSDVSQEEE